MLTEAFKKVVRNGEIKLIRKRLRKKTSDCGSKIGAEKSASKSPDRRGKTCPQKVNETAP
ncbi:hypothetical protein [Escherichia coli ISC7]|uniref:Uncharacterized protein n=1 Tax=Escherichia coli ISC7 TaxID=1432555 RepID=W1F144_ECOLX|nr:hypothetical protein [Escherichia coli ISC7]